MESRGPKSADLDGFKRALDYKSKACQYVLIIMAEWGLHVDRPYATKCKLLGEAGKCWKLCVTGRLPGRTRWTINEDRLLDPIIFWSGPSGGSSYPVVSLREQVIPHRWEECHVNIGVSWTSSSRGGKKCATLALRCSHDLCTCPPPTLSWNTHGGQKEEEGSGCNNHGELFCISTGHLVAFITELLGIKLFAYFHG